MKRILLILPVFIAIITVANAQNLTIGTAGMPFRELKTRTEQGSPYFNDQFVKSDVLTTGGKHLSLEAIRYNILNQQVEYLSKDVVYEVQDSLQSFQVTDSSGNAHALERQLLNGKPYFFEVLASGKLGLLKRYTAKQSETENWYTKKKVRSVVRRPEFYVLKAGKLEQFTPSKKNVQALFTEKPDQVKSYLNNNTPDFGNDESLKELFEFYNSLN